MENMEERKCAFSPSAIVSHRSPAQLFFGELRNPCVLPDCCLHPRYEAHLSPRMRDPRRSIHTAGTLSFSHSPSCLACSLMGCLFCLTCPSGHTQNAKNAPPESRIPERNSPPRGPDLGAASPSSMPQPPHLCPPRVPWCLLRSVEVEKGRGGGGALCAPCSPRVPVVVRSPERKGKETNEMTPAGMTR